MGRTFHLLNLRSGNGVGQYPVAGIPQAGGDLPPHQRQMARPPLAGGQARGRRGADQPPQSAPKSTAQGDTLAAGIGRAFQPFTDFDHMQA